MNENVTQFSGHKVSQPVLADEANNVNKRLVAIVEDLLETLKRAPKRQQPVERLWLASRLVSDAAFALSIEHPGKAAAQLFLIATCLENEIEKSKCP